MSNLIVIYDQEREIAAMVDAETQEGWGPAMIGPDAYDALQAFLTALPFDPRLLSSQDAVLAFQGFVEGAAGGRSEAPPAPPEGEVEQLGGDQLDAGERLADAEAAAATDVPAPQPVDVDQDATEAPQVQVVDCFNCQGEGVIHFGDDVPDQQCNMCQGKGRIAVAA